MYLSLSRRGAALLVALALIPVAGCTKPGGDVPASLREPDKAAANDAVSAGRANALVTASAKCSPAVVTVNTVQTVRRRVFNPFFSPLWQEFYRDFMGPPYQEYQQEVPAMGSGFIFDPDGYILTAEHVVHGADKIEVTLPDGRTFPAAWVGSDYEHDVAVLKIDATNLPYVELGDSSGLMIGEWAIAIGNPFGNVVESASPTVSVGVISAVNRQMRNAGEGGIRVYDDLIQTDASINPGNSGGPLVDATGRAVGINVTIITTSGGSLGIGFAVPINRARVIARTLIQGKGEPTSWIGVYPLGITPAMAKAFGLPDAEGVMIGDIDENGPAFRVNLGRGDVILGVDGKPVKDVAAFEATVAAVKPGGSVQLKVRRGQNLMTGNVAVEKQPGP